MPKWIRVGLGLLLGVFAGGGCIALVELLGHSIFQGKIVFVFAVLGLGFAAFIGGVVSAWISKWSRLPWVIAIILAGLSLMNVLSFKHPVWFVPVAFALIALGAWLASRLHKSKATTL